MDILLIINTNIDFDQNEIFERKFLLKNAVYVIVNK